MEQTKQVKSEKIEFEHRVKTKIIAPFGIFGTSGFICMEKIRQFFYPKVCQKLKTSDRDVDGNFQASTFEETWF